MKTNKPQTASYWKKRKISDRERDWLYNKDTWVEDYWESRKHPHRQLILEQLSKLAPFTEIGEVGCNAGPNIANIRAKFRKARIWGIDASPDAIALCRKNFVGKNVVAQTGDFLKIPWENKSMDVVIADAVLMYSDKNNVQKALKELLRVAKKAIILVERETPTTQLTGMVWAHPYTELLKGMGLKVTKTKIRKKDWTESRNWYKYGYVITAKL